MTQARKKCIGKELRQEVEDAVKREMGYVGDLKYGLRQVGNRKKFDGAFYPVHKQTGKPMIMVADSARNIKEVLAHELVHLIQYKRGYYQSVYWAGNYVDYYSHPGEFEAENIAMKLYGSGWAKNWWKGIKEKVEWENYLKKER